MAKKIVSGYKAYGPSKFDMLQTKRKPLNSSLFGYSSRKTLTIELTGPTQLKNAIVHLLNSRGYAVPLKQLLLLAFDNVEFHFDYGYGAPQFMSTLNIGSLKIGCRSDMTWCNDSVTKRKRFRSFSLPDIKALTEINATTSLSCHFR